MRSNKAIRSGLLPALCCLLAMLLAGCSNGNNAYSGSRAKLTRAPDSQQTYRYGDVASDIATFDPAEAVDQPSLEAIMMVFTGLVQLDDNLQVQPQMAKTYDLSPDGLTYTFHLRPNLKFSDGTPLSANDVAYSIDRALSPAVANINGGTQTYLGLIKDASARINGKISTIIGDGVKVIDSQTVQINISQPTSYFLQALTYPTAFIVEKSVIDKWGTKWTDHLSDSGGQGGDGPFRVLRYNHSTGIAFVPNPHYYGPHPVLKRVDFDFYKTPTTAYQAYQADQVDFVKNVPPAQVVQARLLPNQQYIQSSQLTIDYIAMNYLYKPFDNIHIREAFELAINKDVIAHAIYNDTRTATCHIVPSGMPGYNPNLQCPGGVPTRGDVNMARALFQQGLREEGLTVATFPPVKISYRSNDTAVADTITTMRQAWQAVLGVNVGAQVMDFLQLVPAEIKTFCTRSNMSKCMNQGLQMWAAAWGADYPDPQDWTSLQFGNGAPNNEWNYGQNLTPTAGEQQQLQQKMVQADIEPNQAARVSMYNQVEQQLVNDVAWMPYDQRDTSAVLKPYVSGQVFNALSLIPPNDWGNIYIGIH